MKYFLWGFIGFLLISTPFANSIYPLDNSRKEAQFNYLLKEFRCLVCQNQNLADSDAALAKDLRLKIYQMVKKIVLTWRPPFH